MTPDEPTPESVDELARAIRTHGDAARERIDDAALEARIVATYCCTLTNAGLSEEAAVHLTCEWLRSLDESIEWQLDDDTDAGGYA